MIVVTFEEMKRTKGLEQASVHDNLPFTQLRKYMKPQEDGAKDMQTYNASSSDEDDETTRSVHRQKVAIMAHPRRGELSAEEVQFK